MKRFLAIYIPLLLAGVITVSSCIRDEIPDCPDLKIRIAVKDKNYFNVDNVDLEERMREDLPFKEYIRTLYWVLRDAETGKVMDESEFIDVEGDEQTYLAGIRPSLPHGKYVLTVWGGLEDMDPLGDDPMTVDFHHGNVEGGDVYLTNDTIVYDAWNHEFTVEMERTKGKLIIEKQNLPSEVTQSTKLIDGLYDGANNAFKYFGETFMFKQSDLEVTGTSVVSKTVLVPSIEKDGSTLRLEFSGSSSLPVPSPVRITMYRNELTVLRYVWNEDKNSFDVYILINDSWDLLNNLTIE